MPTAVPGMAGATKKELEVASILLENLRVVPRFHRRNLTRGIRAWTTRRKRSFGFSAGGGRRSLTLGHCESEIPMDPVNGINGSGEESTLTPDCLLAFCPSSSSGDDIDSMASKSLTSRRPLNLGGGVSVDGFLPDLNEYPVETFPFEDDDSEVQIITGGEEIDPMASQSSTSRRKSPAQNPSLNTGVGLSFGIQFNGSPEETLPGENDDSEVQIITGAQWCRILRDRKKETMESAISEQKSKKRVGSSFPGGVSEGFQGRKDELFFDLNESPEAAFPCEDDDSEVQIITGALWCRTLSERKKKKKVESTISELEEQEKD